MLGVSTYNVAQEQQGVCYQRDMDRCFSGGDLVWLKLWWRLLVVGGGVASRAGWTYVVVVVVVVVVVL